MHSLTDNALMLQVKSGDLGKLGLLYERHKKRLFGFFYNMNGNASLSEDLVQNVFERMLKYKHTFTGDGTFTAWMFTTARNVNYDHHRKHKPTLHQNDVTTMEYKLQDPEDVERGMIKEDENSLLQQALKKLAPEKREILVLSKLKEMKFSEIAQVLGCSEGAAKVKAHRALKDLRTVFMQLETG
ncbi:RNA polymerase sigma factor [Flavobacteriaceae bacterium TP-CH-4]|uniref:RNA polymerase sigma factor n=1 Tax=Pelagihabitans pacificus TaxID=2696054 RepID=A0A967ECL7_9FLAO|nr:RNA polymerase sigma factor [Pelagihabitans pacificus]NHF58413.1 RNA polymerase sigma factor [Pelagihabitans pacificus]